MHRRPFITFLALLLTAIPLLAEEIQAPENTEADQATASLEAESKSIIPEGGLTVSTQPITPVALLPEKNEYDQGLEELAIAQDLLKKDKTEASSDVALQAYDDLMAVYAPRRNKKKRTKLRADRHEAATVYINASIAYIESYVERNKRTYHALEEGRARLGDLRDVAVNYPELHKKVAQALEQYSVVPSSPTPRVN
jgi:hypothetical protein